MLASELIPPSRQQFYCACVCVLSFAKTVDRLSWAEIYLFCSQIISNFASAGTALAAAINRRPLHWLVVLLAVLVLAADCLPQLADQLTRLAFFQFGVFSLRLLPTIVILIRKTSELSLKERKEKRESPESILLFFIASCVCVCLFWRIIRKEKRIKHECKKTSVAVQGDILLNYHSLDCPFRCACTGNVSTEAVAEAHFLSQFHFL